MGNPEQPLVCMAKNCHELAAWARNTFFNGDRSFCIEHAKAQEDFEHTTDYSTYEWYELSVVGGSTAERASFVPTPAVLRILRDTI